MTGRALNVLMLGGTAWLGQQLVRLALRRGHRVCCLARGQTTRVPEGAEFIAFDRDRDEWPDALRNRSWDIVFDVSRQPGQVRRSAQALGDSCGRYVFISTVSVYADARERGKDERAALLAPLQADAMEGPGDYGAAKVACEQWLQDALATQRLLIVRPGLIGGPGDHTGRSGYWVTRMHRAGLVGASVLAPREPELFTQIIDVRDLAEWALQAAETGLHGIYNAVGPSLPFAEHLRQAGEVAGFAGELCFAEPQWLRAQQVDYWAGPRSLPLWVPIPELGGMGTHDGRAATRAGLRCRPLSETLRDTLDWQLSIPVTCTWPAGLTDDEEMDLLGRLRRPESGREAPQVTI